MKPLTPFPPQVDNINEMTKAVRVYGYVINNSTTGTGKTLATIETARALGMKPLVICPAIVVTQWKQSLETQGLPYCDVISWEKARRGSTPYYVKPRKAGRRIVLGKWILPEGTLLVLDEFHRAKTYGSQSNIMALTAAMQKLPTVMLSATPFITPLDMSVPMTYAGEIRDPRIGFWNWARTNGCTDSYWGGIEFKLTPMNRSLMRALKTNLKAPGTLVEINKEKLDMFFPKDRIEYLSVDVDVKSLRKIKGLEKALNNLDAAWEESIEKASEMDQDLPVIVELLRLRQQSELAKLPTMAEKAVELLDSGYSVAIFVSFIDSLDTLSELIDKEAKRHVEYSEISGKLTGKKRDIQVADFQDNVTRLALVQISAGGTGVSLHDVHGGHPRAALISPDYSIQNLLQAQGRIARLGAKSNTLQYIVTAAGTVEERIIETLETKQTCLNLLTSNDN